MKFFQYLRFFTFHLFNWNAGLAIFALYHTLRGEKKYEINTFIATDLNKLTISKGDVNKASRYEAVNYYMLENLLTYFRRMYPLENNFFDAGCGKGRAMVVAAHYGFTNLTGIDFARELCNEAEMNMQRVKDHFPLINYTIKCDDVLAHTFTTETVIFLFNPFEREIVELLLEKIEASVLNNPRSIYIIYASPQHEDILLSYHYDSVYRVQKMKYLKGMIAVRR